MEVNKKKRKRKEKQQDEITEQKPKSAYTLFREKYPDGIGYIVNMRAVLK